MKKARFVFSLLAVALAAGCLEKPNHSPGTSATVLYRHHFLGTAHLARSTNNAKIPAVLAMPATAQLREKTLQKLASAPQQLWRKFLPVGAVPQPALFRPLLDDLLAAESYAEARGPLQRGESVLAIELTEERATLWRTNLWTILDHWNIGKPSPFTLAQAKGWDLKKTETHPAIQFLRAGQWALIGIGHEPLTLLPALLEQINKSGRPVSAQPNVPLELEADLPRLTDWLPALGKAKLPPLRLTVTGKGEYLRTEARLLYSEALPWKFEPWKIPTNFVSDPLISFTVGRGIAPLLAQIPDLSTLGLQQLPNQFCSWGPATVHADTFCSIPMTNPSNVLYQVGPKLPDYTSNLLSQSIGGFALISNRNELVWQGWPVIVPYVRAVRDHGTDYLLGGLFPLRSSTNRPPPELFGQLKDRPNLVYYDWEITQERLVHAKQLQQLWDITNHRRLAPTNAPEQKWLAAIGPKLGNTITEVTLASPTELDLVRRSDFGFTGFELATLARWIASPGFPWTFDAPPSLTSRKNSAKPSSNAPPVKAPVPNLKKQ